MSKKLNIILTVIVVGLLSYIIYDKVIDRDYVKTTGNTINSESIKNRQINEGEKVDYYFYSEQVDIEGSNEDEKFFVHKTVYLFEDGKYYYDYADYGDLCGVWSIGNYEINNNKLILKETMHGGCDACYYTKKLSTYTFDMKDDTLISSEDEVLKEAKADVLPILDIESIEGTVNCDKNLK